MSVRLKVTVKYKVSCDKINIKTTNMDKDLKELFRKAFNKGSMYEATLSRSCSFNNFIDDNIEQLILYGVVKSFYCGVVKRKEGEICEQQCAKCEWVEMKEKQ